MSEYWPESEFWLSLHSIVTLAVAMGAVMIGFFAGRWRRFFGIAVLAFITLYAISLTEKVRTKPERDYAYFFIPDGAPIQADGKVRLHRRATGPLFHVDLAFIRQGADIVNGYDYAFPGVRFPEGSGYAFTILPGDWWIDIDPLARAGQVRQRLHIDIRDGKTITKFAQAKRKFGRSEILCETPKRDGVPPCL